MRQVHSYSCTVICGGSGTGVVVTLNGNFLPDPDIEHLVELIHGNGFSVALRDNIGETIPLPVISVEGGEVFIDESITVQERAGGNGGSP